MHRRNFLKSCGMALVAPVSLAGGAGAQVVAANAVCVPKKELCKFPMQHGDCMIAIIIDDCHTLLIGEDIEIKMIKHEENKVPGDIYNVWYDSQNKLWKRR